MLARIYRMLKACWQPAEGYPNAADCNDALLWYRDLVEHACGQFSIAVVQANALLEDQSQIETGSYGTLVGIYDGHGGPEASRFINDHLFLNLQKFAVDEGGMSVDVLRKAFLATEDGFVDLVTKAWQMKPQIAAVGSCCMVGVIWGDQLYVANLGDSRAVLASVAQADGTLSAMQLSTEHNASIEAIRQELKALHPEDPNIVALKRGIWRVKGIIQVSRSIGDVYLKKSEFNREPLLSKFRLPEPLQRPILTAEPTINVHTLRPQDQFLIFASDGLWEHLTNQEAVHIVSNHPRTGIARRLIKAALHEAARKREMRYSDLRQIDRGVRRHFHDDITVVVIFLDYKLIKRGSKITPLSVRSGMNSDEASSNIFLFKGLDNNLNETVDERLDSKM
ncbi:hypothetical protein O6H91_17G020200 [Diphasiastrum complanatum]|uniref:Uncharacterized protein n=2 Tax=Diphasiastrum complanatum TaxID=34168 RepID=A0ACC2B4S6_DIPCM|nr:hypothetical protein O6H91_17G020200 [Diphasiastrum complanatum]KAJ7524767.1 hypothetical protein O6H91_17G020200 [Diphasiastrum complanatum]